MARRGITRTLFLPFAGFDYDKYTAEVATAFENFGEFFLFFYVFLYLIV